MTSTSEIRACEALRSARLFLTRWGDQMTLDSRDDMAQEAAIIAWQQLGTLRDPARFTSLVRTVTRRLRYRKLMGRKQRAFVSLDAEYRLAKRIPDDSTCVEFEIAGTMVPMTWLIGQLDSVLSRQSPLNRAILRAYYQGFSCSEVADRYQLPPKCVKVRLYRSRRRVRREFEARVGRSARRAPM